jgi:hypothetical protein
MKRRGFFGALFGTAAAAVVAPTVSAKESVSDIAKTYLGEVNPAPKIFPYDETLDWPTVPSIGIRGIV